MRLAMMLRLSDSLMSSCLYCLSSHTLPLPKILVIGLVVHDRSVTRDEPENRLTLHSVRLLYVRSVLHITRWGWDHAFESAARGRLK